MTIRCKHCQTYTQCTSDVARSAGWRMFKGVSLTGKPLDDVACPTCAGTATKEPVRGWLVRCNTCDWESDDPFDDMDEEALNAKSAREVAADHECEKSMQIQAPGETVWRDPHDVNDDGSLRGQKPAAGLTAVAFTLATPRGAS